MLFKIRCRSASFTKIYKYTTLIPNSRQYSSFKDDLKDNNNCDIRHQENDNNRHDNKDGKISNVVTSFLQNSLDTLENYIINQAPTYSNDSTSVLNHLEVDNNDDDNNNIESADQRQYNIPLEYRRLNNLCTEFLDISNPNDRQNLLTSNKNFWYKVTPEINQSIDKACKYNLPLILNYYLRSLPEIQAQLNDESLNTKLGENSTKYILNLLINLQWFKNASYIIYKLNLPFNELVNLLNDILESQLIFENSKWMKYLFLINFYRYYKNLNSLVLTNLDFLSSSHSINTFKILNMIYNKDYQTIEELDDDVNQWNEINGTVNKSITQMQIYKSINLVKLKYPGNLKKQFFAFKSINLRLSTLPTSTDLFLSSYLKNIIKFSDFELNNFVNQNVPISDVKKKYKMKLDFILTDVIINKQIPIKSFDALSVLHLQPEPEISLALWENHLMGYNKNLNNSIYYKFLIEKLINSLEFDKKINEILKIEFSNVSPNRKIKIICSSLTKYFKFNDMLTRNHVGGYIALTNNKFEHSYVTNKVVKQLFYNPTSQFKYPELLKFLELIASFSPTLNNKENLFEVCNDIIEKSLNDDKFEFFIGFNTTEKFEKSVQFIELIRSIDLECESYIGCLEPSIIKMFGKYIEENKDSKNMTEILNEEYSIKLFENLNKIFDLMCQNPRSLSLLNPRNYPSKIYLTYQGLLQKLSIEIFKLPKEFLLKLLKSRVDWICNNETDWIFKFNKKIFIFGIFLEVLSRRGTRDDKLILKLSNLSNSSYRNEINKESRKLSGNAKIWESIESLCGFEWNEQISNILIKGEKIGNEEDTELGHGIMMVLNELKKSEGIHYIERNEVITNLTTKLINNNNLVESSDNDSDINNSNNTNLDNITDSLLDSINNSHIDDYNNNEDLNFFDEKNNINSFEIATPNSFEYSELYESMKNYQQFTRDNNKTNNVFINELEEDELLRAYEKDATFSKTTKVKRFYSKNEKLRLVRLYSPLRMKGLLIEHLVEKNPTIIDALIRRLFIEYNNRIPVILIHSCMIGIIKSKSNQIAFTEKINLIKVLDVIVSMIYNGATKRKNSYLFMNYVKFKEFRVLLIDLILKESKTSNSGSLKTLNWAMNKITNSPNLNKYKSDLNRWTNELNNMRELKLGFWNPLNEIGKWNNDKK